MMDEFRVVEMPVLLEQNGPLLAMAGRRSGKTYAIATEFIREVLYVDIKNAHWIKPDGSVVRMKIERD